MRGRALPHGGTPGDRGEGGPDDADQLPPVEIPIDGVLDLHTFRPAEVGPLLADYLAPLRGIRARADSVVEPTLDTELPQGGSTPTEVLSRSPEPGRVEADSGLFAVERAVELGERGAYHRRRGPGHRVAAQTGRCRGRDRTAARGRRPGRGGGWCRGPRSGRPRHRGKCRSG